MENKLGMNQIDTAQLIHDSGCLYYKEGMYVEAVKYFFKSMKIRENKLGIDHVDTSKLYYHIGCLYHK
jgi:hypothetical protein